MNLLFSTIGKRGYLADYFRPHLHRGERIIGTSNTAWTPGFAACDVGVLVPPIASDEYIPAVFDLCTTYEIGGLLSFYDPDVVALSAHRDEFAARGIIPMIPTMTSAVTGFDKWKTFQVLSEAGITTPDTTLSLQTARESVRAGRWRFPLVVKPRHGFGSASVFVARNDEQLAAFFGYQPEMLIQQFIEGDMYDIEVLADTDSVLEVVAWHKLLSRIGETEHAETVHDDELLQLGHTLAEVVGLIGPMDVDLFRRHDGQTVVLELNLRFGGGYPVSHLAGAQFPKLIMEALRGGHPAARIKEYRAGVCMIKGVDVMGGPTDTFLDDLRASRRS